MMIFKNQTIVISGGASGIGLEVAKKVMSNNGTAIIVDRNNKTLNNLKLEKFDNFLKSQADVTDSGNYTCDPASNYSKWVIVHVTTGLYIVGYI